MVDDDDVVGFGKGRTATVIAAALAIVVTLLVSLLATRAPSSERATRSPLLGKLAPTLVGTTLDGEAFDLSTYRGRWVVVNFFGTWCTPCIEEHPQLASFQAAHAATGDAALVSVLFADKAEQARAFFERNGGSWPVVADDNGAISVAYGVARVPESFLVAPTGIVVQKLIGGVHAAALDDLIAQYEAAG